MKAIVYGENFKLQWCEVPEPQPTREEILVKVVSVGICGSELSALQEPSSYRKPPLIMGHEIAGIDVGTGRHVAVNPLIPCGRCAACRSGRTHLCPNRSFIGIHRGGGFAEYVSVPSDAAIEMPRGMSFIRAALAEPLATVLHFLAPIDRSLIDRVGIIGTGGIGMLALVAAKEMGFPNIEVAELSESRRKRALDYGAARVEARLNGRFDLIVDAVGTSNTRADSLRHLGSGGRAIWVGLHDDDLRLDDVRDVIRREATIVSSFAYTMKDFRDAVSLLERLPISSSFVEEMPFSSGLEAFDLLMVGKVTAPKVQLVLGNRGS